MPDRDQHHSQTPAEGPSPEPDRVDVTGDYSGPDPAAPRSVSSPASPPRLSAGRYQLLDEIAHGGMGVIWRAIDTTLGREVAVKVLMDKFAPDSGVARRFEAEARITAQLQHPAIPPVHDYGKLPDDRPFLAMKLIKGHTLEELLRQRADPAAERGRFVAVFEQICQAVAYAHAHRVIHRDLKPGNVMVGSFGEVQVMDWGLAKVLTDKPVPAAADPDAGETVGGTIIHGSDADGSDPSFTQAGSILGTLAYMPPEQAAGEIDTVNRRSDVFGLGAMLAVILTGKPPYAGANTEVVRVMAIRGDLAVCLARLDGCGAEPELVTLCKRCLAFAPADRPKDAGAVAEEVAGLRAAAEEWAQAAEKERAAAEARAAERRKRRRWQAAVAAASVLILALLGAGAWWKDRQAAVAAERDRQEAKALLDHAQDVLAAGDLAAVEVALNQAENRVGVDSPADFRDRLVGAKRDRDVVRDLRRIDDLSWVPGYISSEQAADMARLYRAAFAHYGLDLSGVDLDAEADAVKASRVSSALLAGLSEWFCADPKGPQLRQLLDRLDPDPDRAAIREAIQAGDEGRVRALVKALDGSKVPTWFAASIGYHGMVPPEDGVRLMAAAWRAHPSDYVLAYQCGIRLWGQGEDKLGEMLAWARAAVALRPDSPFAHNLLGRTWQAMRNWDEAEVSFRRAIELGKKIPKYAGGHINMGNMLTDKGDFDGAEASFRSALAIEPDSAGIHYNMGFLLARRGDLARAEAWYRKAVALAPTNAYYREVLDGVVQRRAKFVRLEEIAAGRANPATTDEAFELVGMAADSSRRQYRLAVRLFIQASDAKPAVADDLTNHHRYSAACCAVLAAAGQDKEQPKVESAEWSRLTGLALKWLRADLAQMTSQAKEPKRQRQLGEYLKHWKRDPNLVSVRDPASLAAMPSADRKAWEALWREVYALLGSLLPQAGPPSP